MTGLVFQSLILSIDKTTGVCKLDKASLLRCSINNSYLASSQLYTGICVRELRDPAYLELEQFLTATSPPLIRVGIFRQFRIGPAPPCVNC